jgi:hypothetical protein
MRTVMRHRQPDRSLFPAAEGWSHVDGFATPRRGDDPADLDSWVELMQRSRTPRWIRIAMALRDAIARPLRLTPSRGAFDRSPLPFPVLHREDRMILCGLDDRHLDFRVVFRVDDTFVSFTTAVRVHRGMVGRVYWAVVRRIHPFVVRSILRRIPAVPAVALSAA